jgi:hypothetical protein
MVEITQWQSSLRSDGANCHVHPASLRCSISGSKRPIDRLRLVIVHNKQRAQDHMVVAAYQDSGWLILGNSTMALITDVDASSVTCHSLCWTTPARADTSCQRTGAAATRPLGPAIVPVDLLENQMAQQFDFVPARDLTLSAIVRKNRTVTREPHPAVISPHL